MSVLDILSRKIEGNSLQFSLLATGIISSSYFFYGNMGAACFGIMPAIKNVDMSVSKKVALWKWNYQTAKFHMADATMISAISYAGAALLASSPSLGRLLFSTAALSFAVGPWTGLVLRPINNELFDLDKGKTLQASLSDETSADDKRAIECLNRWSRLHRFRIALGLSAWVLGFVGFVASV